MKKAKKMTNNEQWGNIELPGLSDEELFSKKWNQVRDSANLVKTKDWKEKHKQGINQRSNTWHENVIKANKKKYDDPNYLEQHRQRMAKRTASEEWQQKVMQNAAKKRKRVMTPAGEFESRVAAAEHYNVWPARIGVLMKKFPNEYYYID